MRKIELVVCKAFVNQRAARLDNTMTDGKTLYLHGNAICKWVDQHIEFTLAGWNTPTTRSRVNAVSTLWHRLSGSTGERVACKDFTPHFRGEEISEHLWYEL